jgi:hypothetical protein
MKSLTSLFLIASVAALIGVGVLAVTPVFANNPTDEPASITAEQPAAPVTGAISEALPAVDVQVVEVIVPELSAEAGNALASTFSANLQKDRAGAEAAVAIEIQAIASLNDFVASVSNGKASQVTGIYVDGLFSFPVVSQPSSDPSYVSATPDQVTQFGLAAKYGSQAFLAHNYLAGATFSELAGGQTVTLVYGDGTTESFMITKVLSFQALSPDSTQSSFVDLESGEKLSASSLFHTVYNNSNAVVLQTCIDNEGISTWGRLFVVAVPMGAVAQAN